MEDLEKNIILNALNEDLLDGSDVTSECLIPREHKSSFELLVNEDAILAGLSAFKNTFLTFDSTLRVDSGFQDGDEIKAAQVIAAVSGNTINILKCERTALNLTSHLSGIATLTRKLVDLIKHTKATLLDTRKNTAGLRYLEKKAVLSGGGKNHRFNLTEMVLIKDNHISFTKNIKEAVSKTRKSYGEKYKIEIEVSNLQELKEAINTDVDLIMFDNWDVNSLKDGIKLVPNKIKTEASGQITPHNIKAYAESGVDFISTSYMIKNAQWIDFSLNALKSAFAPCLK